MILPTIHLNGTSPQALLEQVEHAGSMVHQALLALDVATPNGRDYYPQGPGALQLAIDEHHSRVARLRSVSTELSMLAEHIADYC